VAYLLRTKGRIVNTVGVGFAGSAEFATGGSINAALNQAICRYWHWAIRTGQCDQSD
jgi:hypothetical protein